jgi:homoserine O-succinyltransferase
MHLGHPEYGAERLPEEYARDRAARADAPAPAHVDCERPVDLWRQHRETFFAGWLQTIETSVARIARS